MAQIPFLVSAAPHRHSLLLKTLMDDFSNLSECQRHFLVTNNKVAEQNPMSKLAFYFLDRHTTDSKSLAMDKTQIQTKINLGVVTWLDPERPSFLSAPSQFTGKHYTSD